MTKLSKSIREQMARALVMHRFKDRATAMTTTNRLLFERAYKVMYDSKTRAAMDTLLIFHDKAFTTTNRITVNVGMRVDLQTQLTISLSGVGMLAQGAKLDPVPVLAYHTQWDARVDVVDGEKRDPTLYNDIREFATGREQFNDECSGAYSEALSALESFTTGKRLAEGWPEAIPVIGHLIPEGCRTLPTVRVESLNAKFDLPPKIA